MRCTSVAGVAEGVQMLTLVAPQVEQCTAVLPRQTDVGPTGPQPSARPTNGEKFQFQKSGGEGETVPDYLHLKENASRL